MKYAARQPRLEEWPAGDRLAWEALFAEGDILDGAGPARHWRPATGTSNRKAYAQWLGWLGDRGLLGNIAHPWTRATPELVRAYASDLIEGRSRRSVATAIIALKCVLIRMAPDADWRWLRDLTNRLDAWAGDGGRKANPSPIPVRKMFSRILEVLNGLKEAPQLTPLQCRRYRDALIAGLLIAIPVRLHNIAQIEIGTHLVRRDDSWWLIFATEETKTGQAVRYIVPDGLVPHLEHYINVVRGRFAGADQTSRLWMAGKRAPLAENTLYQRNVMLMKELFGVHISPQDFRVIDATFLAEESVADALRARPLLGHRQAATTQRYYIRASSIEASRKVADAVEKIRDG